MSELAITQGDQFLKFSRNGKVIALPGGTQVLGPLKLFPHVVGDFAIRQVVVAGPMPGPLETSGAQAPVIAGDVVVITRTISAMGAEQAAAVVAAARAAAKARIDAAAEAERGRYLTAGSGQAMVYGQKVAEARDHQAGGAGPWPHLTAEVGVNGADEAAVAAVILATEAAWLGISARIEGARLNGKKAVAEAGDLAAIAAAEAAALADLSPA
jgi:hypothetical protein